MKTLTLYFVDITSPLIIYDVSIQQHNIERHYTNLKYAVDFVKNYYSDCPDFKKISYATVDRHIKARNNYFHKYRSELIRLTKVQANLPYNAKKLRPKDNDSVPDTQRPDDTIFTFEF